MPHPLLGLAVEGEGATWDFAKETLALDKLLLLCTRYCACKVGEGVLPDLPHVVSRRVD